jgi:hypothetical protein
LRTKFNEVYARFSPEPSPRWVAYQSDETGRAEVYISAFPERRGKFPISTGGGQYPEWGAGGRELFYVAPDNKLMAVDLTITADTVRPSTPRPLFTLPIIDNGYSPYDTIDGQRFLVRAVPQQSLAPADGDRQLARTAEEKGRQGRELNPGGAGGLAAADQLFAQLDTEENDASSPALPGAEAPLLPNSDRHDRSRALILSLRIRVN